MAASIRNPVVVILGSTGTGKTKLSLELAKLFNGEIISADSMQLYRGLDIITNKATAEERRECRHHMIDFLSPLKENSTVVNYRDQAVPIIDSLLHQKKTPIIVGGTNYYIEALLWKHLVNKEDIKRASTVALSPESEAKVPKLEDPAKPDDANKQNDGVHEGLALSSSAAAALSSAEDGIEPGNLETRGDSESSESGSEDDAVENVEPGTEEMRANREKYDAMSNTELHQRLKEVDPKMAIKMHPNDRRKIIRAIEVYDKHGVALSEIYKAQQSDLSGPGVSGPLRYTNTCVFWLQCSQEVLDKRLDDRVDKMLELGLVEELTDFHRQYNEDRIRSGRAADYTTGIFQSIGFKEFHDYLILSEEERQTEEGKKALQKGIEDLKLVTRRYARYQNRWVKKRFLQRPCRESVPPVYGLDCTDVSEWEKYVSIPATEILTALRQGEDPPIQPLPYEREHLMEFEQNVCKYCSVTTVTAQTWQAHVGSRKHRNNVRRYKKQMYKLTETLDTYVQQEQRPKEQPEETS